MTSYLTGGIYITIDSAYCVIKIDELQKCLLLNFTGLNSI